MLLQQPTQSRLKDFARLFVRLNILLYVALILSGLLSSVPLELMKR